MKKIIVLMGTVCLTAIAIAGVTTHLKLDCRTGVRAPSSEGELLRYDADWYENGDAVRITDNGTIVATGVAGTCVWRPEMDGPSRHLLKLEVLCNGKVIGTETASFAPYVRDVTARQLWPHNKVSLSFTVAEEIGEVKGANEELAVWCARGAVTNVATRILGDRTAKPGVHRIVWDMEADGLKFTNDRTIFGVSIESVEESLGSVQLWKNGSCWAECNVDFAK